MRVLIFVALKVAEVLGVAAYCWAGWLFGRVMLPNDPILIKIAIGCSTIALIGCGCFALFGLLRYGLRYGIAAFIRANWRLAGRITARLRRKP